MKTIFEKIKDELTIRKLAELMVFETHIEDGDYDYDEDYVERWTSCYSINIPAEFRNIAGAFFDCHTDIEDFGFGTYDNREEAVDVAMSFLRQSEQWRPQYDEHGDCVNGFYSEFLKESEEK